MKSLTSWRHGFDRSGLWYGFGLFGLLGLVLPFWAIPTFTLRSGQSAIIAYLIVLYGAAKIALLAADGAPKLLDIAYATFVYGFLALPFLAEITAGQYPLGTQYVYSQSTIQAAELVIVVGIVGYEAGRQLWTARTTWSAATERRWQVSPRRAYIVAYLGLAFVLLAVARHGLSTFFTSRDALTAAFYGPAANGGAAFYLNQNKTAGGLLQVFTQVPIFVGTYFLLRLRHESKTDPTLARPHLGALAPLIIGNIIVNNPIANARFWFGAVLIGFASIYLPLQRRSGVRMVVFVYLAISLFSFQQLAAFRRTDQTAFTGQSLQQNLLTSPDYASGQQILNAIDYVSANGYRVGQQFLAATLVEVPHAVWPGKPGDTGQLVGGAAGFKVSAPVWTDGDVDFGIPGVLLYLGIVGVAAGALDRRFSGSSPALLLTGIAPVMSGLMVYVLRGSVASAMANGVIPVMVMTWCCGKRPRRRPAPSVAAHRGRYTAVSVPSGARAANLAD